MTTITIETLETLLSQARQNGCKRVKLQLYDNWEDLEKEQRKPTHPIEDYQLDARYYNTVEFETQIIGQEATDKILTKMEGDLFIIRVSLSDRDALFKSLGFES